MSSAEQISKAIGDLTDALSITEGDVAGAVDAGRESFDKLREAGITDRNELLRLAVGAIFIDIERKSGDI